MKLKLFCIDHHDRPIRFLPFPVLGVGEKTRCRLNDAIAPGIPELNPFINEATGIYWLWKHLDDPLVGSPDLIGICHYRRFFYSHASQLKVLKPGFFKRLFWRLKIDTPKRLARIIHQQQADGIIVMPIRAEDNAGQPISLAEHFTLHHGGAQWFNKALKRMGERRPAYAQDFLNYAQGSYGYFLNMSCIRREYFEAMCETCFPVIFEILEEFRQLPASEQPTSPRFPGFIFERLTGAYWFAAMRHGIRLIEVPVLLIE